MNIQPDDEFIVLSKDVYVLNSLAMGIAVQILAQKTGISIEKWRQHLIEKASEQYNELSGEQIQGIVDIYEIARNA